MQISFYGVDLVFVCALQNACQRLLTVFAYDIANAWCEVKHATLGKCSFH